METENGKTQLNTRTRFNCMKQNEQHIVHLYPIFPKFSLIEVHQLSLINFWRISQILKEIDQGRECCNGENKWELLLYKSGLLPVQIWILLLPDCNLVILCICLPNVKTEIYLSVKSWKKKAVSLLGKKTWIK